MKKVSIFVFLFVTLIGVTNADVSEEEQHETCKALKGLGNNETCMNSKDKVVDDAFAAIEMVMECLASGDLDEDEGNATFNAEICGKILAIENLPSEEDESCQVFPALRIGEWTFFGAAVETNIAKVVVNLLCACITCLDSNGLKVPNLNAEVGLCKFEKYDECPIDEAFFERGNNDTFQNAINFDCGLHKCAEKLLQGLKRLNPEFPAGCPHPNPGPPAGGLLENSGLPAGCPFPNSGLSSGCSLPNSGPPLDLLLGIVLTLLELVLMLLGLERISGPKGGLEGVLSLSGR